MRTHPHRPSRAARPTDHPPRPCRDRPCSTITPARRSRRDGAARTTSADTHDALAPWLGRSRLRLPYLRHRLDPYVSWTIRQGQRSGRLHGLIRRLDGSNRYLLTADGLAFAVFDTKLGQRVLPPLFGLEQPNSSPKHAVPCKSSNAASTTTSNKQEFPQPETCHNVTASRHQGAL
jgi:hypothetical protein